MDDDQRIWKERLGVQQIEHYKEAIKEDLDWLGIRAVYTSERDERIVNESYLKGLLVEHGEDIGFPTPYVHSQNRPYPHVSYLTAVKVVQDHREQINPLIRGDDLLTEFSLYCYFCRLLKFDIPTHIYLPKLTQNLEDLSDVSKTKGDHKIRNYRERGWNPQELKQTLKRCCLVHPEGTWEIGNIKRSPTYECNDARL